MGRREKAHKTVPKAMRKAVAQKVPNGDKTAYG